MANYLLFLLVAASAYQTIDACNSKVHCEWNAWERWGECSATCGSSATKTSTRTKKRHEENGGTCTGAAEKKANCDLPECPIHCEWDKWDEWGECSEPCGGGVERRTRKILKKAENNGLDCAGESF